MEQEAYFSEIITFNIIVNKYETVKPKEMSVMFAEISAHRTCSVSYNVSEPSVIDIIQESAGKMSVVLIVVLKRSTL